MCFSSTEARVARLASPNRGASTGNAAQVHDTQNNSMDSSSPSRGDAVSTPGLRVRLLGGGSCEYVVRHRAMRLRDILREACVTLGVDPDADVELLRDGRSVPASDYAFPLSRLDYSDGVLLLRVAGDEQEEEDEPLDAFESIIADLRACTPLEFRRDAVLLLLKILTSVVSQPVDDAVKTVQVSNPILHSSAMSNAVLVACGFHPVGEAYRVIHSEADHALRVWNFYLLDDLADDIGIPKQNRPSLLPSNVPEVVWGIQVAHLVALRREFDERATFNDVCAWVKVRTEKDGMDVNRSYASHLLRSARTADLVKETADYFVSYAWGSPFASTMQMIEDKVGEDVYVFLDVFVLDQHAIKGTVDVDSLKKVFGESLSRIGKAVIPLVPLQNPLSVSRIWCCFELYMMESAGIPYVTCFNPEEEQQLIEQMKRGEAVWDDTFSGINVEKATAREIADQEAILAIIRDFGVLKVNDVVMLALKKRFLEVCEIGLAQVPGPSEESGNILHCLGSLHETLGNWASALPFFERALREARYFPDNEENMALRLVRVAHTFKNLGKLKEAEQLQREAIAIHEKAIVGGNPTLAAILRFASDLNSLAELLRLQGMPSDAEPFLRSSIDIYRKALGDDHAIVAGALNDLAGLLQNQGKYAEADRLYAESRTLRVNECSDDHSKARTSLNNQAELLRAQGRFHEAEPLYRRALAIGERVLGPNHVAVAWDLNNLAELFTNQGKFDEAEPLYRRALGIVGANLGRDHADFAEILNNLACVLYRMQKLEEAEGLYRESLDISRKKLGNNHPDVATNLSNLAGLLVARGKLTEAEPMQRDALTFHERAFGRIHEDVATDLNSIGKILYMQGKLAEAEPFFREAIGILRQILGHNHFKVAFGLGNLATLLAARQGRLDEARHVGREALDIATRSLGPQHPFTTSLMKQWGMREL